MKINVNDIINEEYKKYTNSTTKSMIFSCFFQLISCVFIYAFSNLALLVTMDIAYWPPFMNFNLNNYTFWSILLYLMLGFTLIQFIFSIFYRKYNDNVKVRLIALIIASIQLLFVPFGTFFGITEILEIRDNVKNKKTNSKIKSIEDESNLDIISENTEINENELRNKNLDDKIGKNISLITIASGLIYEGFLYLFYLITIYFSTVQLDITYPYLTMGILLKVRIFLLIFSTIFAIQIIFGIFYEKLSKNKRWKWLYYLIGLIQIFIIPIGSYSGIYLLKSLKFRVR